VVLIDGGVRNTIAPLRRRIEAACRERGTDTLDIELLVVTHIDNDHILGILELLGDGQPLLRAKDIWFNGRPQLIRLPAEAGDGSGTVRRRKPRTNTPPDLLGGLPGETDEEPDDGLLSSAADLLGTQQGDDLSQLLETRALPWNVEWGGNPIFVPDRGSLPVVTLDGKLELTLLGPTLSSLHELRASWLDLLGGDEELRSEPVAGPPDLLGRRDTWPPVWSDEERRDPSITNGSSIMLLAEYGKHAVLLTGDGHAADLTAALERLRREREMGASGIALSAFKVPHHASAHNLNRALMENVDCGRYLISTDGSTHRHPDHQAILRILRYSSRPPELLFNYASATTLPWGESKHEVLADPQLQDYETYYPAGSGEGFVLVLD